MFKRIVLITLLVLILIIVIAVVLHWRTNVVGELIQELLNRNLAETVQIHYKSLSGDIFQNIKIEELVATFEDGSIITSNLVKVNYSLFANVSRKYLFNSIFFDSLYVFLNTPADTIPPEVASSRPSLENLLNRWASSGYYDSLFAALPQIDIGNLTVSHGKLEVPAASLTLDSITVKLSAHANSQSFGVQIDQIAGRWLERNFTLSYFHTQLIGKPERITLNQLQLTTPYSHAYANGEIDISDDLLVILNLEDIQIAAQDFNALSHTQQIDSGQVHLSFHIVGSPNRFSAQFNAHGAVNNYRLDSLIIDGDYAYGEIIIRRGKILANESLLEFKGKILENENSVQLKFVNLDINRLYPNAIHTDLSGRLEMELEKLNFKNITGTIELMLYNSSMDTMHFDSLRFAVNAVNNHFKIVDPSFLKFGDDSRFTLKGDLDRDKNIDLNIYTENNSFLTLTSALNVDSVSGMFDANLFLSGALDNPNIEGYIWIPTITKETLRMDSLILITNLEKIFTQRHGKAYLTMTHGGYGPVEFTEIRADLLFNGNLIQIDTLLFANRENYISSSGFIEFNKDKVALGFDFIRIYYENYWIENNGQVLFTADSSEVTVQSGVFSAPDNGLLELRGLLERSSANLQMGLLLQNIHISPIKQFIRTELDFSGVIESNIELFYSPVDWEMDITLQGQNLVYNKVPLGAIDCAFQFINNAIYVSKFTMSQGNSHLTLDGDIAMQIASKKERSVNLLEESLADLNIIWQNISLDTYAPLLKLTRPLQGQLSGNLKISGTLVEPQGVINIRGENILYDKFISDSIVLAAEFKNDTLVLNSLFADINETAIEGHGWLFTPMDLTKPDSLLSQRPFELNLRSVDDNIEFIRFLNDQVERITGPYELNLLLNGALGKPALSEGSIKLSNGKIELSRVRNHLTNVKIDASLENSLLTINTFSAQSAKKKDFWEKSASLVKRIIRMLGGDFKPEGIVDIEGTILFKDLIHPELNLTMDMYQLYIDYFVENTQLLLSADDLYISGRDTVDISGSVDIDEGSYIVDLAKLQKNIYLVEPSIEQGRALTWNLDISIPGNFIIRSSKLDLVNNFQFEIAGNIRSIQEPYDPNMELTGSMEILTGKYGSWGQNFEIQSGTINFINPNQINPEIDILAEKRSRGHIFELSITGNLEKQQLDLQVKDETGNYINYSMSDKLTLLSLGTTTSNLQAADLATAGQDVITTSVETALGRGMESITGLDKVEVSLKNDVVDLQSMKLNNGLSDASISFGKYLTSNLYLEYKSQLGEGTIPAPKLSWAPGNQIFLEYRFNKNWSINSFYAQTQRGSNLIKLSLSWKTTF